jgi:excinuclease ABC subunit C
MYAVLDIIKQLYHPRTCNTPIKKEGISSGKYKVCLDYHIKKCLGPCVGKQNYEEYQKNIQQAREILKGNTRQILRDLKEEMLRLSEELRFEEAEEVKRK